MTDKLALVVDDSRVARMMLCKLLQTAGFVVVEQGSADEALAWLDTAEQLPMIIFMDLMMPGMDGLTATRQIKKTARWQAVPVVICTSNDSEADKLSAHESGVLALLSKPPEAQQLQTIINNLFAIKEETEKREPLVEQLPVSEISVAPSIDEILAQVEQQLLPNWLQQTQNASEQISQRMAEEAVSQEIDAKLDELTQRITARLTEQVSTSVQDKVEQQLATQSVQMQTVLSEKAADAAETAMQNLNQSAFWQQQVSSQTEDWLVLQQQQIQQQLMTALTPKIESAIAEQLAAVPNSVDPIIETLQEEFAQLQLMQKQLIKRQRMNSALLMITLAATVFALLQINLF